MTNSHHLLALGLDGGGTQTRAQVMTEDGAVRGEGQGGACNIAAMTVEDALASALAAADAALAQVRAGRDDVTSLCAGVAGTSFAARREAFAQQLGECFAQARVSVVPDFAIALSGATAGQPGVVVIAGTGSVAYGENAAGLTHRAGGYGYLVDDSGSGYGVGRAALAAALRAADGTGEQTTLTPRILSALELGAVTDIVPGVYGGAVDRIAIATLSRAVSDAAVQDNDPAACAILMRAGGALATLAHGVTAALFGSPGGAFPVVTIGGLWNAGVPLTDVFARSLARFAPMCVLQTPLLAPVQGAALRAKAQAQERQAS